MAQKTTQLRRDSVLLLMALFLGSWSSQTAAGQAPPEHAAPGKAPGAMAEKKKVSGPKMSDAQKIALAMSAGPAEIAKNAAIREMPMMPGEQPKQLREGTNGWVCYASVRQPMCLDGEWQKWAEAWMNKSEPKVEGVGIAYMLRGDKGASNRDPYATEPSADNEWVVSPPHIMVLVPDAKALESYTTDPKSGGPWVMWKGTPYAHIMVPVSLTKGVTGAPKIISSR